jgi:hypothetical protein
MQRFIDTILASLSGDLMDPECAYLLSGERFGVLATATARELARFGARKLALRAGVGGGVRGGGGLEEEGTMEDLIGEDAVGIGRGEGFVEEGAGNWVGLLRGGRHCGG